MGGQRAIANAKDTKLTRRNAKVAEVDEGGRVGLGESCGDGGEEGFAFDFAVGAEAGGGLGEVGVVVAGVADELEGAVVGEGIEELGEGGGGEVAGGGDADGACCGLNRGLLELVEAGFETAEKG